jgi:energy-coupling factor transport system ATP-binding protein
LNSGAADPVIVLKAVSFSYDGVHEVLDGVSLEVSKGERVAVLGRNGSGKSTLVKILGALQVPSRGVCFVCGRDTADSAALVDIHKWVSLVFQNPESQIVGSVVEDDVAFAPENQGLPPAEIEKRVELALKKVGLLHKRDALSSALSGGEKQRLALAGALALDALCLILDEPTAMLDPEGRQEVEKILRDIHASGTTILHVTHRLEDVAQADRVLVLSQGRWAWQGRREDFWSRAESLGFQLPPLLELRRRLVASGVEVASGALADLADAVAGVVFRESPACSSAPVVEEEANEVPIEGADKALFETHDLSYSFDVSTPLETRVLKSVTCRVPKGAWVSVLGRTGSGKSTLIQHLNGLYTVQSGEVSLEGGPLPQKGPELRDLRRRVGLVFQSPEDQLFSPTVSEELSFAPRNWGFSEEETETSVRRALESVGLGEAYLPRNPLLLSGGERRLAAIASVLAAEPECVVLDEPTAGLDAAYRERIIALLWRLKEAGKTIVTVTHDFEMAFERSDRLLIMDDGRKVHEGSVSRVLPLLLEAGNASTLPEILQLTGLLRQRGLPVPLTWDVEEFCRWLGLGFR